MSMVTNLIGVYIARLAMDKARPERFWTIAGTLRGRSRAYVESELKRRGVQYTLLPAANDRMLATAFCASKAESSIVKEIFAHEGMRYTVTENVG